MFAYSTIIYDTEVTERGSGATYYNELNDYMKNGAVDPEPVNVVFLGNIFGGRSNPNLSLSLYWD